MNRIPGVALAATLLCAGMMPAAQAQPYDIYFGGSLGVAMPLDSETTFTDEQDLEMDFGLDNSALYSGSVGLIGGMYRSEIEVSHQSHDFDKISASGISIAPEDIGLSGQTSALSALINAYFDFDAGANIKPYLTAGAGIANVDFEGSVDIEDTTENFDASDTAFAYKLGGGLGFDVTENFTIDLGYRFFSAHSLKFETMRTEVKSHNLSAGFRFRF